MGSEMCIRDRAVSDLDQARSRRATDGAPQGRGQGLAGGTAAKGEGRRGVESGCSVKDGTPDGGAIAGDTFSFEVSRCRASGADRNFSPDGGCSRRTRDAPAGCTRHQRHRRTAPKPKHDDPLPSAALREGPTDVSGLLCGRRRNSSAAWHRDRHRGAAWAHMEVVVSSVHGLKPEAEASGWRLAR